MSPFFFAVGSYEYSMGTHCFFSESSRPGGVEDACFNQLPEKLYDYFAKTDKVLKMKRIFVEEKETESNAGLDEGEIEDLEHLRVTKTYGEALNQFLKAGEKPPREIVQDSPESGDDEEENRMDVDQNTEEPMDEVLVEPSEDSANTKMEKIQEQFEKLTDPDFDPNQMS